MKLQTAETSREQQKFHFCDSTTLYFLAFALFFVPLQVSLPSCMSADWAVWLRRFPRKLKITLTLCTSCSALLRRPCMLAPSPNGFDRSSPNRGRSSVTPGMDFSNLVSGGCRVDLSSHSGNRNTRRRSFLSQTTQQFNEVLKLNTHATGCCLLILVFQNGFSRYQDFKKRISYSI